ncbi:MAG: SMC-Scp complex subunit ScpB [Verrucomicrobiota bacterium]
MSKKKSPVNSAEPGNEEAMAAPAPGEEIPPAPAEAGENPDVIEDFTPAAEGETPYSATPLKMIIEAILFASQKAVSAKELSAVLKGAADADKENLVTAAFAKVQAAELQAAIEEIENDCARPACVYELRENAAGWQLVTKPGFAPWLRQLYPENRPSRISAPALETLAIIAYRQPITRADIEAVRGVAVDGVMQTLLDRGLVKIAGRSEMPGRPLLYETTQNFMEHFGLKDLDDLPNANELRKINLPKAAVPVEDPPPVPAGEAPPAEPEVLVQAAEAPAVEPATETPDSVESHASDQAVPAAPVTTFHE